MFETAVAFVLGLHGEAFASQEFAEQGREFGVVIDQQDVHAPNLPRCGRVYGLSAQSGSPTITLCQLR